MRIRPALLALVAPALLTIAGAACSEPNPAHEADRDSVTRSLDTSQG